VAAGEIESWQRPCPTPCWIFDEHFFFSPHEWDELTLGSGDQRRMRVGVRGF
jgi:hypothetical protein